MVGLSSMVVGSGAQEVSDRSFKTHLQLIEREELRKSRLAAAEKWKDYTALAIAILIFAVLSFLLLF